MEINLNDAGTYLSTQIAKAIRDAVISSKLIINQRLPSQYELSDYLEISHSTVREALKRLTAQSLFRIHRGAKSGAFINRIS